MSRIGKKPVIVPKGVAVSVASGVVKVKGPKGERTLVITDHIVVKVEGEEVILTRQGEDKQSRQLHGLYRALIATMVKGVTEGFVKNLEMVGVGYRATMAGKKLSLALGYSHPIEIEPPAGITVAVEGGTKLAISGIDKALVGQVAADIKCLRPVEPYKGKGIRYQGQYVRRKAGKAAKAAGAAK